MSRVSLNLQTKGISSDNMYTDNEQAAWVHPQDRYADTIYNPTHWKVTGYYGGPSGQSHEEQNAWFQDPYTFEFLNKTRHCFVEPLLFTHDELVKTLFATKVSIERQIAWRAQPFLKKEISISANMSAGLKTEQEWDFLLQDFGKGKDTHLSQKMRDHGERRPEELHRVTWTADVLPDLVTPCWYMKKWSEGRTRWRALITSLSLVRHSWSENVRIEFTYRTWWFRVSPFGGEWVEV